MITVYLCGPMEGLTQEQSSVWRELATASFKEQGIKTLDPTRRKKFHDQPPSKNLSNKILAMDFQDIDKSDMILMNLRDRGPGKCWGSMCEMTYAFLQRKPIITLIEKGYYHPFVESMSTEIHHSLKDAIDAVVSYSK